VAEQHLLLGSLPLSNDASLLFDETRQELIALLHHHYIGTIAIRKKLVTYYYINIYLRGATTCVPLNLLVVDDEYHCF
jgi:hypothetical protein